MLNDSDKVVLITGGTGGIGQAIAIGLARLGGTIVIVGRDKVRGQAALADIRHRSGNPSVELMLADLSSQQDIRKLASEFRARYGRLDVLVNNVGGLYGKRWETVDGIEFTLAINHLCPFLLTHLLLPLLQTTAPSRIVNVNSEGHRGADTVDFDSFQATRWKKGFRMYCQSKLANLLFSYELSRQLSGTGITVNAVHPGIVDTQLFQRFVTEKSFLPGFLSKIAVFLVKQVAQRMMRFDSAETAAECPVYLASSSEVAGITGKYFDLDKKMIESSPASHDAVLSRHVWKMSAELTGLTENEMYEGQIGLKEKR